MFFLFITVLPLISKVFTGIEMRTHKFYAYQLTLAKLVLMDLSFGHVQRGIVMLKMAQCNLHAKAFQDL